MPWKETRIVDERIQFIAAVAADPRGNFTRLCARFGISRAKGYKWLERYEKLGPAGLENQPPVARSCPHRTPDAITDRIVALRKAHPFDGPKKLRARLLALPDVDFSVPAASTIGEILDRYGMIRPRKTRVRTPRSSEPLGHAAHPNDVWCVDFKGHFACGDGARCHPLTISDASSRFLLKCEALRITRTTPVIEQFERTFREFGLPLRIRSDNGPPFASVALGGLSRLSVWWIQLGIIPERIEPGHPEQNGRHERMHRTLNEQTAMPPAATFIDQQRCFDRFRADYNYQRPHEALGQIPPARVYEPSSRVMPEHVKEPEYAHDFSTRRVSNSGQLKWKSATFKMSRALHGMPLGFRQVDESSWHVFFGPVHIANASLRGKVARIDRLR
jgi:putative transposase